MTLAMTIKNGGRSSVSHFNIDIMWKVLKNSVFHPYVTALVPLCLRAGNIPYSDPAFRNTVIYALFIFLFWVLSYLNERMAGGKPRPVNQDGEVVVITGGANGLGCCLAEIYALRGASVAVIDIQQPNDEIEGVEFYECDVADSVAVGKAWAKISENLGQPTVLINNAGIVNSKSLLELSPAEIEKTFQVNTISHYVLASLFLRPLIEERKPGTLVTVSSVLGRLGAAHLSAYAGSKAALIAYHNSISAELQDDAWIKTILVTPGQLSTEMFSSIRQNRIQKFFGPTVEVQELAVRMVQMISEGKGGVIAKPTYAGWVCVLDILPASLSGFIRRIAGVDTAMIS